MLWWHPGWGSRHCMAGIVQSKGQAQDPHFPSLKGGVLWFWWLFSALSCSSVGKQYCGVCFVWTPIRNWSLKCPSCFTYSIPLKAQIRQENTALKHQKRVRDEAYGSLIKQNLSPVCAATPIKYLCCGLQWINFCINPPLFSFLLLPLLILRHVQSSKQSQKGSWKVFWKIW